MVENLAQQTANHIVDKIVSGDPNKVEDAFTQLNNKLYVDVYNSDPSTKAAEKFVDDVFHDINAQYANGKTVPHNLALVWANQQIGHELPANGFNLDDLKNIATSTEPNITVLDKRMAGALMEQYPDLQHDVQDLATGRVIAARECTERKDALADWIKKGGDPDHDPFAAYWVKGAQCDNTVSVDDRQRMAGVVREIPASELQTQIKYLDATKPMELNF